MRINIKYFLAFCARCGRRWPYVRARTIAGAVRRATIECASMICAPHLYDPAGGGQ